MSDTDEKKRDALIMSRVRHIIKAHKATSNGRLYSDIFGTGMGTGRARCRLLGFDPDSNVTSYRTAVDYISQSNKS